MRAREVYGEVLTGPERQRRWSLEEKLRILAQSVAPGSSVSLVCRMHGISRGQLYTWRRQFRTGELTGVCAGGIGAARFGAFGGRGAGWSGANTARSRSASGLDNRGGAALGDEAAPDERGRRGGVAPRLVGLS